MIKIYNFLGDLTDISARKYTLANTSRSRCTVVLRFQLMFQKLQTLVGTLEAVNGLLTFKKIFIGYFDAKYMFVYNDNKLLSRLSH